MARFYGKVGFGQTVETGPGVWEDDIVERKYIGDVLRNTVRLEPGDKVNTDVAISNSISIVADGYARSHLFAIKYVEFGGGLWTIESVEVEAPRLILRVGGVYNGLTPETPNAA